MDRLMHEPNNNASMKGLPHVLQNEVRVAYLDSSHLDQPHLGRIREFQAAVFFQAVL
jgi:hypothetical protein